MSTEKITIEATIAAVPDKVWDYWTDPGHITNWNFASDDWHCPSASNDVKPGGRLAFRMEARDGSFGFDLEATYTEVQEPSRMAYTLEDGRKVVTTFEDVNGSTKVTTVFEPEKDNPPEMQRGGWQAILDNFRKYVEENS